MTDDDDRDQTPPEDPLTVGDWLMAMFIVASVLSPVLYKAAQ